MKKLLVVFLLALMCMGVLSAITPASAYSNELTGIGTQEFDNSQQTFLKMDTKNIFCFDNMLAVYSDNAVLTGSLTFPTLSNVSGSPSSAPYAISASIIELNATHIIVGRVFAGVILGSPSDQLAHYFEYALINVNTLNYVVIGAGYKLAGNIELQSGSDWDDMNMDASIKIIKNTNDTGTFYYGYSSTYGDGFKYGGYRGFEIMSYLGKTITGVETWGISQKYLLTISTQGASLIRNCGIVLDSGTYPTIMPPNYVYFLSSNNWRSGNRANIYLYDIPLSTMTFVGVTSLDDTYSGKKGSGQYPNTGFVYLLGLQSSENLIDVLVMHSLDSGDGLGITTIIFNSTYVSQYNFVHTGLVSDNVMIRPYTFSAGNGIYPSAGTWSTAYFTDAYTTNVQDLVSLEFVWSDISGWEEGNHGAIWTPETPQVFNYPTCLDYGGFQGNNSHVGLQVDMRNGKAVASYMSLSMFSNSVSWGVYLSGGGFTEQLLNYQTTYELNQNTLYSLKITFLDGYGTNDVSGDISIISSALSIYQTILTTFSFNSFTQFGHTVTTQSFTNGEVVFTITPRSATQSVYQAMIFNFTTTTGGSGSHVYWFKFLSPNDLPEGATPTPTYYGGGSGGFGTGNPAQFMDFFVYFLLLFIPPIVLGAVMGAISRSGAGVLIGFTGGLILMIVIGVIVGFIPFWAVIVIGIMLIIFAVMVFRSMT